jgi:hypothetical protein
MILGKKSIDDDSLKNIEASFWILLLCEFCLKSLKPCSAIARSRMPDKYYSHKIPTLSFCFDLLFYC